jgi:phosphoribosylformylglycinamidine synthase
MTTRAAAESASSAATDAPIRVHRFEVRPKEAGADPRATALLHDARSVGVKPSGVRVARIYLVRGAFDDGALERIGRDLLANPVLEVWSLGAQPVATGAQLVEVHPLPGVMDPAAQTVVDSIHALLDLPAAPGAVEASTGWRYEFEGVTPGEADRLARRLLANTVIHAIHTEPYEPDDFLHGHDYTPEVRHIAIRDLGDADLERLSRDAHLFVDLAEMRAIQEEFKTLGREPTDIELETLAQTWSEHCVHKTLKSRVWYRGPEGDRIDWAGRPGVALRDDGSVVIDNLLKRTVAAATFELIEEGIDWTLSVFVDNAGIIAFDADHAVCVKVETHNHPSAIEPYGGAATGAGGCIRDVLGTGLAARPIAATDVFCVAPPDAFTDETLPAGCLHPRRILTQVVAGVRDYGNRVGVPTLSGAVAFDDRYVGNPLVYCGCIGVMPRELISGAAKPGDRIVALGGRTGRDGIHGATFSSAELTDTHADEFSHAVQIGNAIEEKKVIDLVLRARDVAGGPLFHAITDCGAGGFSSAVGEMGEQIGAEVQLEMAPLKYAGLSYTEIWISEAQERMVLAVPPANMQRLRDLCAEESVEMADLGVFGTPGADLVLRYGEIEVGRMPMAFLHDGIPTPEREATWSGSSDVVRTAKPDGQDVGAALLERLSDPNIASKRWIIRQYDHEVQGGTVLKPLVGPLGEGPGDASVIEPVPGSGKGLAISQGLATSVGDPRLGGDPYLMALAAIDECVRNLVCVGTDPERIAILDNFCWPSCRKPENFGSLVRAAVGCYDGAKAYRTPFVSGKDSLNNQFTTDDGRTIEIPPTLLITGIGIVHDVTRCITSDAKAPGNVVLLVGPHPAGEPSVMDLEMGPRVARAVHACIRDGLVRAAHDCSEGGWLVALAEMLIAGSSPERTLGAKVTTEDAAYFVESPSRYLLEVAPGDVDRVRTTLAGVAALELATLDDSGRLDIPAAGVNLGVPQCAEAFLNTLNW